MAQDLTPQLRTRLTRVERLVGLFVSVAMVLGVTLLGYFLWHTAVQRGWLKKKARYFTWIQSGVGLKPGTPVVLTGFTIGKVTRVDTTAWDPWMMDMRYFVYVEFEVLEPYYDYILTDSEVRVGSGDFLGARSVEITRGVYGLRTVSTNEITGRFGVLSKDFYFEKDRVRATNHFRKYLEPGDTNYSYYLSASDSKPLPETLADIATEIKATIPGITNRIFLALDNVNGAISNLNTKMPKLEAALDKATGTLAKLEPALGKPGGIGELLVPTNLNTALNLTLSNLNANAHSVGPLMTNINVVVSNINSTLTEVRGTVATMKTQLEGNTNLVTHVSDLAGSAARLANTTDTLLRRHWLFRSAFKTNAPAKK